MKCGERFGMRSPLRFRTGLRQIAHCTPVLVLRRRPRGIAFQYERQFVALVRAIDQRGRQGLGWFHAKLPKLLCLPYQIATTARELPIGFLIVVLRLLQSLPK